jgi:TRAP-type uncharacterized transport system fused permease subunit
MVKYVINTIAVLSSLFVIFAVSTRYFSGMESLGVYLATVLVLTFLSKPLSKTNKVLRSVDYLLAAASIVIGSYSFFLQRRSPTGSATPQPWIFTLA